MAFIDSMQQRYTTKKYDASKNIDSKILEQLKEIVRLSPSSINSQPWKFIFVSDEETKRTLSNVSWLNTKKVLDCDTLVVFARVDSISFFEAQIEEALPQGAIDYYQEFIKIQSEEQIKAWFGRQLYLALGVFLSACASMKIDSTPMEGIVPAEYDRILGLENHSTTVAVAIGYRDEEDFNQVHKRAKSRIEMDRIVETI